MSLCIFHKEVEIAVAALKKGKFGVVDNIPVEIIQVGWETMVAV